MIDPDFQMPPALLLRINEISHEGVPSFLATIRCLLDCVCSANLPVRGIACPSYCGVCLSVNISRRSRQRTSEPAKLAGFPASAVRYFYGRKFSLNLPASTCCRIVLELLPSPRPIQVSHHLLGAW